MIVYMAVRVNGDGGGEAFYYGKSVKKIDIRRKQHEQSALNGSKTAFHRAIMKYGFESFIWVILGRYLSKDDIAKAEIDNIRISRECGHYLYNMTKGGDGGSRINQTATTPSVETKKKIAESLRNYYKTRPGTMTGMSGELSPFYGKKHTEESRRKMSEAHKKLKKPHTKGYRNPSARSVFCETTNEMFGTATEAATKYKTDLSSIIKCCKGKQISANGRKYSYYTPGAFGWTEEA